MRKRQNSAFSAPLISLIGKSALVLLDWQAPAEVRAQIRRLFERGDDRVVDLHVWSVGPGIRAAVVSIVTHDPRPPAEYKVRVPEGLGIVHLTVETHLCSDAPAS